MPVGHLAVEPVTVPTDVTVGRATQAMVEEGVGDVIVVEDDEPVGIVTDRDVAMTVPERDDPASTPVTDVMTPDPATIREDAEDVKLPRRLAESRVRRLPVVDGDGTLTGVVTLDDVVATVGEELEHVATVIESQSPGYSP